MEIKNKTLDTREKVFKVALEEFANKSFKEVSTREITKKAGVNLSSIKYYFGDKESLYRAVYEEPLLAHKEKMRNLKMEPTKSLEENLRILLFAMVEPLKEGKEIEQCMRLRLREVIDKTGLVEDSNHDFKEIFHLLETCIKREIPQINERILKRLCFAILSQIIFMFIGKEVIEEIDPNLMNDKIQVDSWVNKAVFYALKMIELEKSLSI